MKTGAIVLAAGESQISNIPLLKRELDTLRTAGISPVVVVTGHDADNVMKELVHRKVIFVHNPDYKTSGMMDSIQLGISRLDGKCSRAVITPADVPSFSEDTISIVTGAEGDLVIPSHNGKPGHPLCIDMRCADAVLDYSGSGGMRGLIDSGTLISVTIDVDDPGILIEADSKQSFAKSIKYQEDSLLANPVAVSVDVGLGRTDTFFDSDTLMLLNEIKKCSSMNKACKNLGMAYSRGWTMIKYAEGQLGFSLMEKKTGGKNGGGSGLTEAGDKFLQDFRSMQKQIEKYADKCFDRVFADYKDTVK